MMCLLLANYAIGQLEGNVHLDCYHFLIQISKSRKFLFFFRHVILCNIKFLDSESFSNSLRKLVATRFSASDVGKLSPSLVVV